jgi:hypothetical protein
VAAGSAVDLVVSTGPAPVQKPQEMIKDLRELVQSMTLRSGIRKSLDQKLKNAIEVLDRGRKGSANAAIGMLNGFIGEVEAQRGKAIADAEADQLVQAAIEIIEVLTLK